MTHKAVVLAAGRGGRLERRTDGCSKCLVTVAGRPLLDYVLNSIAGAGIRDVVLVVGYHGEQVEAFAGNGERYGLCVDYAWNRDHTKGNASSLWRALPLAEGEPFLLTMGDHLCSASLLRAFLDRADGRTAIAVDHSPLEPAREAEATKVALRDGLAIDLGKQLDQWDAVDTGFSHWAAGALAAVEPPFEGELAALMSRIARSEGGLAACDISGDFWLDIDTEDDLRRAEEQLRSDEHLLD